MKATQQLQDPGQGLWLDEHSVSTQGVISKIDSLDQWGVELGMALAQWSGGELRGSGALVDAHDGSTTALIRRYLCSRGRAE